MSAEHSKEFAVMALLLALLAAAVPGICERSGKQTASSSSKAPSGVATARVDSGKEIALCIERHDHAKCCTPPNPEPAGPFPWILPDVEAQLDLEWTQCRIHRIGEQGNLELRLPGRIASPVPISWLLRPNAPVPQGQAALYFVEDVFCRSGPAHGTDLQLQWAISLNGGPAQPMTVLPDNSLTTTFPSGVHGFELIISGNNPAHTADGYYRLTLDQELAPVL